MRVFVALDLDDAIRARLEPFLDGVRGFAPEARWVRPESMHVTLKFIGEKSSEAVDEIKQALGGVRAGGFEISFRGHRILSDRESAAGVLDRHCGQPATGRFGKVGG